MTINYDKNVIPSDLTDKMILSILLIHQERSLPKEHLIKLTKQITYTFTDYVDKYEDIKARFNFILIYLISKQYLMKLV